MPQPPVTRPTPRSSLLRFLLPVLLLHALLLAGLPYWTPSTTRLGHGVNVELAPIATEAPGSGAGPATTTPAPATPAEEPVAIDTPSPSPERDATPLPSPRPHTPPIRPAQPPSTDTAGGDRPAAPTAPPAAAEPAPPQVVATAPRDDWQPAYRSALRSALAREHHYPARARRFGLSGTARVAFVIARDGRFHDIHLTASTGTALLDRTALDTVRRLGRFRPLPPDYSGDGWAVSVPLVYRLD